MSERPLRWKLADAISFAVTGAYGHASDYLVEADAALSVIAALAEDDAAVERVARALVRNDRNYVMYHMPGDQPKKWKTPGGAIWDTNPLGDDTVDRIRAKARAALRAMGKEIK